MMRRQLSLLLGLALATACVGQDGGNFFAAPEEGADKPAEAAVEKLPDGRLKLLDLTFDPTTREIRFPAAVNMTEGLLEFLIVHERGKIHESLLSTRISPTHLNVVLKLLRYEPSQRLYSIENPQPADDEEASRLNFEVEWIENGETRRANLREWVSHAVTETAMPTAPWIYGGSFIQNGNFLAEATGDLVAIYLSDAALINYDGKENGNDEVWFPYPRRVPAVGTPVTVIISPDSP